MLKFKESELVAVNTDFEIDGHVMRRNDIFIVDEVIADQETNPIYCLVDLLGRNRFAIPAGHEALNYFTKANMHEFEEE